MIPSIVIRPGVDELQELMIQAGKTMVGVAKGVGQWSGNKKTKVKLMIRMYKVNGNKKQKRHETYPG